MSIIVSSRKKALQFRKKRYLTAIEIEEAKPHQRRVMKHMTTRTAPPKFNPRQFERLIEIQDDEVIILWVR